MPPLVSVVIPTYRRPSLLQEAVASVVAQTFHDVEIIIVADGDPAELATVPNLSDRAMQIVGGPHCGRPGAVRNRGARAANGRLLAFLDDDDLWLPNKLERQVALHGAGGVPISHTRERWLRNGREVAQPSRSNRRSGDIFEESLCRCVIGPSTVMLERPLFLRLGGFRPDLEIAEDYELWLRIACNHRVAYLDEPLTIKRAGLAPQLSERWGQIEGFRIEALRPLIDRRWFRDERLVTASRELARKCRIYATGARKRHRYAEAERYERWASDYWRRARHH